MTRQRALYWLRNAHGWLGLWGAGLGLMFGLTGILLMHRSVLPITLAKPVPSVIEIAWEGGTQADYAARVTELLGPLGPPPTVRVEPGRELALGERTVSVPGRWIATLNRPRLQITVEYWVGNRSFTVKRNDFNAFGMLTRLHKADGLGATWILLADSIAGSIVILSLSGLALWTRFQRRRMVGLLATAGSLALAAAILL